MTALAPAFAAAAALILVAGLAKLNAPAAAALALGRVGLPGSTGFVRLVGTLEVALGTACLLSPGPVSAALLGAAYVSFAFVVARLARLDAGSVPCGCFGAGSFTATRAHAGLNLGAAAVAAACAFDPPPGPLDWFADPLAGVAAVAALACSTWLAYVIFTLVPSIWTPEAR